MYQLQYPKHVSQYISYTYPTYYAANACDMIITFLASFPYNLELINILRLYLPLLVYVY